MKVRFTLILSFSGFYPIISTLDQIIFESAHIEYAFFNRDEDYRLDF